jgi:hypothetical protein
VTISSWPTASVPTQRLSASERIFISRRQGLTVAVSNRTNHPVDLLALNHVIVTAIAAGA